MKISIYKNIKTTVPEEVISMGQFLNNIKFEKWHNQIQKVRTESDKDKRSRLKEQLPCVTVGGVFSKRGAKNLIQHSGFICIDIDNYTDREELEKDPYTFALFVSSSGNGLAVIVRINGDKHEDSYRWLSEYYFKTYGIVVDEAPKNVASARYVSSDPDLFMNPKARKGKTKAIQKKKIKSSPIVYSNDQVDDLLSEAISRGVNVTDSYEEWRNVGFALVDKFGESGRGYFHRLSMVSEKYDSGQVDRKYSQLMKSSTGRITIGTLYYMLQQKGVELPKPDMKPVHVASIAKKAGRSKESVAVQLTEINGLDPNYAQEVAQEVFDRDDIDLASIGADPARLNESLIAWIEMNHPLRKNMITGKIEENGTPITDRKVNTITLRAQIAFNLLSITKQKIEMIIDSDNVLEYNPISDYIDKNRHRNSTGNVDRLISTIETDTPNGGYFMKKWLVSLIAAHHGNPVRSVLALVGGQNTGKTEWFRRLLPRELKPYYGESKLDAGKDDEMLMCQKLILMDDEMGGKSKQDEKRFKELTSKSVFSLRLPYARHNEDFKRLAVLCGTSNDERVINDPTGNTRIFPINVLSINHDLYNSIDKDELFLELVRMYDSGFDWLLTKADVEELKQMGEEFEVISLETELIEMYFNPGKDQPGFNEFLSATEIKAVIEKESGQKIFSLQKLSIALKKLFGKSTSKWVGGKQKRGYYVKRIGNVGEVVQPQSIEDEDLPF